MMLKNIINTALLGAGCFIASGATAALVNCTDLNNSGAGNKNASSALDVFGGAAVSNSNCGPHQGNDSNSLSASLGGYGYNMSTDSGVDGGWVELDKADGSNSTSITGTGWGSSEGTFSFVDGTGFNAYLVALKFGNVFSTFTSDAAATNWGWYTDTDNGGQYDISHLTVYGRYTDEPAAEVSEPAPLLLAGLAFLGLGFFRRKMG